MTKRIPPFQLTSRQRLSLLIAINLSAFQLYLAMPVSLLLYIITLSLWQLLPARKHHRNGGSNTVTTPGLFTRLILIALCILLLYFSYGIQLGRETGTTMITIMTLLKMFEIRNRRDIHIILFTCFFLLATHFFQSQQPGMAIYAFFTVIYLTALLIAFSDKRNNTLFSQHLKTASRLIAFSLPLMLVMFVLFPRIPGPLWGLPDDAFTATTGLSEEMSPGSINNLVSSPDIAFRVKFNRPPPLFTQLYWRGAVLSVYDGKTWRRDDAADSAILNLESQAGPGDYLSYTVTLEPHNLNWLFTLEYPVESDRGYRITREAMLVGNRKITAATTYSVLSDNSATDHSLFAAESLKYRLLPVNYNPQARRFATQLLQQADNNADKYIRNILRYFKQQPFYYTLSPASLGKHAVDDFLFKTRRGFCEHYASSFVFLMRAVGIPARIVVGYMGGEINPLDNLMTVRQSDAHAWAEVWLDHRWQRVDPTAAVSPERIEHGVLNAGLETDRLPLILITDSRLIKQARFMYDSMQNHWNQWVIGYDQQKQLDLLGSIGMKNPDPGKLVLWLVFSMTLTGMLIIWRFVRSQQKEADIVQRYYHLFSNKLARIGLQRKPNEGALEYQQRLSATDAHPAPFSKTEMALILKTYRKIMYGQDRLAHSKRVPGDTHQESAQGEKLERLFIRKVRAFKVRRQHSPLTGFGWLTGAKS